MLHIKLKGIERRASYMHIFCLYIHHGLVGLGQNFKTFFLNVVMLHIKLKGKKYRPTKKKNS